MNTKDDIVRWLAITCCIVIGVPVIGATLASAIHGEPVTRPEFLAKATEIVIYILGIISGYVLGKNPEQKP